MGRQPELGLEVLGQKRVEPGDGEQVEDATRRPEHEDVVAQQSLDRLREVAQRGVAPLVWVLLYLGGDRAAAIEPLGEGEHGRREEEKERGDKDEAEPPGADPARILGGDPRVHGEVHVEPRREGAQDEAHGRPQDPHPDRDGEVER